MVPSCLRSRRAIPNSRNGLAVEGRILIVGVRRNLPPAMPVCAFGIPIAAVTTASRVPRFHRDLVPLWS